MSRSVEPGITSKKQEHELEWDRLEWRSTWIALTIALLPIPLALVISWGLGSPPWRDRIGPTSEVPAGETLQAPDRPGHEDH